MMERLFQLFKQLKISHLSNSLKSKFKVVIVVKTMMTILIFKNDILITQTIIIMC